jgi:hypothetical protein
VLVPSLILLYADLFHECLIKRSAKAKQKKNKKSKNTTKKKRKSTKPHRFHLSSVKRTRLTFPPSPFLLLASIQLRSSKLLSTSYRTSVFTIGFALLWFRYRLRFRFSVLSSVFGLPSSLSVFISIFGSRLGFGLGLVVRSEKDGFVMTAVRSERDKEVVLFGFSCTLSGGLYELRSRIGQPSCFSTSSVSRMDLPPGHLVRWPSG